MLSKRKLFGSKGVYTNIVRWWLAGLLLIMPFHFNIYKLILPWNNQLSRIYNRLDEITVLVLFLPAIISLYKKRDSNVHLYFVLLLPIFAITLIGFISGMYNQNPLLITTMGTFDYVKHFLVIFIYAAFIRDFDEFKKIFRPILMLAIFIGLIAVAEECWWLYSKYVVDVKSYTGRLGLYRATSLMSQFNIMGLYCLLIFTIYMSMSKKINIMVIFSLVGGIITSISRTAFTGLTILSAVQIYKGRKWLIALAVPLVIGLTFMSSLDDFDLIRMMKNDDIEVNTAGEKISAVSFRIYALQKALNVWKDYPVIGAGPGMFGGSIAYKNRSPLYEEYNFHTIYSMMHSLDQLWPQVLAEEGIVGTAAVAGLFISLYMVASASRRHAASREMNGLFTGLSIYTVILFFFTFSANFNIISVLFPYCALLGMGLGSATIGTDT